MGFCHFIFSDAWGPRGFAAPRFLTGVIRVVRWGGHSLHAALPPTMLKGKQSDKEKVVYEKIEMVLSAMSCSLVMAS